MVTRLPFMKMNGELTIFLSFYTSELLRVALAGRRFVASRTFIETSGVCDYGQESFDA